MKRILHIEDEYSFLESMAFMLEQEGFEMTSVTSAEKALNCLSKGMPDLILCDVSMPGMSGFEFIEHAREFANIAGRPTPFIFLSSLETEGDMVQGTKLQADDYIPKKTQFPLVVAKIRNIITKYEHFYKTSVLPLTKNSFTVQRDSAHLDKLQSIPINKISLDKNVTCLRRLVETITAKLKRNKRYRKMPVFVDIALDISTVYVDEYYFSLALMALLENIAARASFVSIASRRYDSGLLELNIYYEGGGQAAQDMLFNEDKVFIENMLALHEVKCYYSVGYINLLIPTQEDSH
jgi:DNA-binding response OmpR family regulator